MDKVLPILEKHVQWIALGIGALFLLLMAYSYAVQQPVTVPLGSEQLAPGDIDPTIEKGSVLSQLKTEMSTGSVPVPPVPPASEQLKTVVLTKVDIPELAGGGVSLPPTGPKELPPDITIPAVPKPVYTAFSMDRGLYQWPKHQTPATAPAGQPVVAPVAATPVQMEQRDLDWWTGSFTVSLASLAEAFKAAKIDPLDPEVSKTAFIGVELLRQERLVDGSWGPETVIPSLPEYRPLMRDLPKDGAPRQEQADYMIWAAQHLQMLVQPVFPQVIAGTPWYPPGTPAPPKVAQAMVGEIPLEGATDPGMAPRPVAPMPQPIAPRVQPGQPGFVDPDLNPAGPPRFAPGGYNPAEGGYIPNPAGYAPSEGGYTPSEGGYAPSEGGYSPTTGDATGIPGGQEGGVFNPHDWVQGAIQQGFQDYPATIYAHDVSVLPGKTYRYRLRYFIRNPLFLLDGRVNPEYANKLILASQHSDYTPDVSVPPRVEFWVQQVFERPGVPNEVEFKVFVAKSDRWDPITVRALAGDQIARGENNSGWSVVDIGKGRDNKPYVLIADTNGRLERRTLEADQNDPRQRELAGVPEVVPGEGGYIEGGSIDGGPEGGPIRRLPPGPGRRPPGPGPGFTVDE